mgnify:CR=1 FL=1
MAQTFFWQIVGAVFVANCLFGLSAFMVWRHARYEDGRMSKPGPGLYLVGLLGPICAIVVLWFLT